MEMLNNNYYNLLHNLSETRTQKIISVILTLIALCLFGLFVINPTLSTIVKLRKEISDNEIVNQKLGEKISALNSLQQAYSRLEDDLPDVLGSIPTSPLVPLFIGQIQAVAKNTNIQISQLQSSQVDLFKDDETSQKYLAYVFSFTGDGTYEDITKFIENITNMQRIVGIETSTINNAENNNKSLRINIQGMTYFKK